MNKYEIKKQWISHISVVILTVWLYYVNPILGFGATIVSFLVFANDWGDLIKPIVILAVLPQFLSALGLGSAIPGLDLISSLLPMMLMIQMLDKLDLGKWGEKLKPAIILPYVVQMMGALGGSTDFTQIMSLVNLIIYISILGAVFDEL